MTHTQKRSQDLMSEACEHIAETCCVAEACRRVGITPSSFNNWRRASQANRLDPRYLIHDPLGEHPPIAFEDLVLRAFRSYAASHMVAVIAEAADHLEPVIHQGEQAFETTWVEEHDPILGSVGWKRTFVLGEDGKPKPLMIRKIDWRPALELAKAHERAIYGDEVRLDHTTKGQPIPIAQSAPLSLADFRAMFGKPLPKPKAEDPA